MPLITASNHPPTSFLGTTLKPSKIILTSKISQHCILSLTYYCWETMNSQIHHYFYSVCVFLKTMLCLFLLGLYYFLSSTHFGLCFLVIYPVSLTVNLDYLLHIFLVSLGSSLMLWISFLRLLSWYFIDLGHLCVHFHLFQHIFCFSTWSNC